MTEARPAADFGALYAAHAADLFRFALHMTGSRDEAEDITSETFVRAWSSPERIEVATVKAYLFTIARNLFLQERRRKPRRTALEEDLRDPKAGPDARAEGRDRLRGVLDRLQALPEADRAALLMRAADAMPYEEIARVLGISTTAAKVKVHRARRALMGMGNRAGRGAARGDGR